MANYFNIPRANPFRFVPATDTPGIHMDDDWSCNLIKSFERKVRYFQKWERADLTKLQVESTIMPAPLKLIDGYGITIKVFPWVAVFSGVTVSNYETYFDVRDVPVDGVYFLYQEVDFLSLSWKAISEPIDIRDKQPGTLLIEYSNSYNDWDVAFTTGIVMKFRCEAGIMDYTPERTRNAMVNQVADVTQLSGTPSRSFKLYIGDARGVAPYVVDILNYIFVCDRIIIAGREWQSSIGSKIEVTRIKGYPLIGAAIEIVEAKNRAALQFADVEVSLPGFITSYNIETAFFGPGALVPINEIDH